MKYLLTYYIGSRPVQEWRFYSKSLAYYAKHELLSSGNYESGKFKLTEI
jgi:hypothetical protein